MSRPTQDTAFFTSITRTQLSCSSAGFSKTVPVLLVSNPAVLQPRHCRNNVGLGFFPFARRYSGNRCFFLLLLLLRCFSSEGWPTRVCQAFCLTGCPIRISADQVSFANPRSFSQLTTSFIASKSLGIPHTPFYTFLHSRIHLLLHPKTLSHLLKYVNERCKLSLAMNSTRFEPTPEAVLL